MPKEKSKTKTERTAKAFLVVALFTLPSCVAPEAVKMEVQGIRNDMGRLEKVIEQKADNTVVAEHVDEINNKIEQTAQIAEELSVWKKSIQAETINYGGAGWVVVGTSLIAMIFMGFSLLVLRAFMKRGTMLSMLTRAVKTAGEESPETVHMIKKHLKKCVHEEDYCNQDRNDIGNFAKKTGNFAKQKIQSSV